MKLAMHSSDFEENTITFLVPEVVMRDMGFYPCELEVGIEELMRNPPSRAARSEGGPQESGLQAAWDYYKSRVSLVLQGKPCRDLDEAECRMDTLVAKAPGPQEAWVDVGRHFCTEMPCGPADCGETPCRYLSDAIANRNNRSTEAQGDIRAAMEAKLNCIEVELNMMTLRPTPPYSEINNIRKELGTLRALLARDGAQGGGK